MAARIRWNMLTLVLVASAAYADGRSTEPDALALMKHAKQYIRDHGMEQAYVEFNRLDGPFNTFSPINPHGDLYMFSTDPKGFQVVHGKNPKIRGKVMLEMRDIAGMPLIQEFVRLCFKTRDERGWVDYSWPHPITKRVEHKRAFVERIPGTDVCLGTGIYK